jgi:sulfite exporter TauE/SafE
MLRPVDDGTGRGTAIGVGMGNWGVFALGALIGMQHALEADHLAALAALRHDASSHRHLVLRGAYWGLGHTVSLFAVCALVLVLGVKLSQTVEASLEFAVGAMVLLLGGNVLRTLRRRRIHFHSHDHGDGRRHVHAHAHMGDDVPHHKSPHRHAHPHGSLLRAMAIGLVHGTAGSGALLVLAVAATGSRLAALLYVLSFGAGSIFGMAALSLVASVPLKTLERGAAWLNTGVMTAIGLFAMFVGGTLMMESWQTIGF